MNPLILLLNNVIGTYSGPLTDGVFRGVSFLPFVIMAYNAIKGIVVLYALIRLIQALNIYIKNNTIKP